MKFIANENFPLTSVRILRSKGYDVIAIGEDNRSVEDRQVMQIAIEQARTIVTFDRDYGGLVFKSGYKPSAGVIYFRVESFLPVDPASWLISMLSEASFEIEGQFTVYELDRIRQRKI